MVSPSFFQALSVYLHVGHIIHSLVRLDKVIESILLATHCLLCVITYLGTAIMHKSTMIDISAANHQQTPLLQYYEGEIGL